MSRSTSSSSTESTPERLLEVGHVRRAHGLRGEVFFQLTSNLDERLDPGSRLVDPDGRVYVVERSRLASKGRRVVKFDVASDRAEAERLIDTVLLGEPIDVPDALWTHELIGSVVVDQHGLERGACIAVVANPAADLLELEDGALVPTNFVVAAGDGRIDVDVPDGLFEEV